MAGIMSWAQINGRNTNTWGEKLTYDVWYVKNVSYISDIKCFYQNKVMGRDGRTSNNSASVDGFFRK